MTSGTKSMPSGASMAEIAALVGDPARANMLTALLGGQSLSASDLAWHAGITPQTASGHLARMATAQLVTVQALGRHRYFKLASPKVASMLETIYQVAGDQPQPRRRLPSYVDTELRFARTCYDHLAGRSGVALHDGLLSRGWLVPEPGGYAVSETGAEGLLSWGVDLAAARAARRRLARPCLDWTERREHLAGSLAAALATALIDGPEPWFVRRADDHRGLRPTDLGRARLGELGWEPVARSA